MNIELLLKKLSENQSHSEDLSESDFESNRNKLKDKPIRTSESVGTLNSWNGQYNDRSFIINEGISPVEALKNHALATKPKMFRKTHTKSKSNLNNHSHRSQHQYFNEENSIESRMRLSNNNLVNKILTQSRESSQGIQRNNSSHRSKQKHSLKPSNTPSFSKFMTQNQSLQKDKLQITPRVVDFGQKNALENKKYKNLNQSPGKIIKPQHMNTDQYYCTVPGRSMNNEHYISDQSGDLHQEMPNEQKTNGRENQEQSSMSYDVNQISSHKKLTHLIVKKNCCDCKQKIQTLQKNHQQSNMKFDRLLQTICLRLDRLEKSNEMLLLSNHALENKNKQQGQMINHFKQEKQRIENQCNQWKSQKEELEQLLKEVLYKRERQKLQGLKQNINSFKGDKTESSIKNGSMMKSQKGLSNREHSESKLKVQNLLQKLQIKVQRS